MTQTQKPVDNRSASQKIQDLHNGLMQLYQTADAMARDLGLVKDAIKLLGNKVDSIVKASSKGEIVTDEIVTRIMIENNVEELKQKVTLMQAQGILAPQEQVGADSFVVGAEINDEGETINPRLQFALYSLAEDLRGKILGSKVGETLAIQEGKLKFKVLESYQIQQPKAPASETPDTSEAANAEPTAAAAAPALPVTPEAAPAAPAEATTA